MTAEHIKTTLDRNAKALELRPTLGQGTAVTKIRLTEGLACHIQEGDWQLTADMSVKSGGANTAPNPGILGRASLGSCLAIGYAMWAARRRVPLRPSKSKCRPIMSHRAEYALDGIRPGYRQVRCIVNVASSAPEADVRRVLDGANAASSYLHIWQDPQDVRIDICVKHSE